MIKLDVAPYCHECPGFSPVGETETTVDLFGRNILTTDIIVKCKNHEQCSIIHKYLKEKKDD